ncbi:MAG: hypothetical protein SVV03_03895, partial [Candidatus Nanohaloarchaea archaeon]|nr:hypothetical protein [Candidatus Nanohaloarchaea archaeon]
EPRKTIDNNSAFYNLEVFLDEYLADFHLHATLLDGNERFAGPSLPDLMSSDSVNKNSLALTYFPHQGQVWFNADYYRRKGIETEKEKRYDWNEKIHMVKDEGVVIDLGSYPTGRSMDWLGAKVMRESLRDMYFPSEKDFLDLLDNH